MFLIKAGQNLGRTIKYLVRGTFFLGMVFLLLMMLLTVSDVFMRLFLNKPILGASEIIEFMMVSLSFLVISLTVLEEGHVRVDLIISRFPPKVRVMLDIIEYVLAFVPLILIAWFYVPEAVEQWQMYEISMVLGIPTFPFYFIVVIGCGIASLAIVNIIAKKIWEMSK